MDSLDARTEYSAITSYTVSTVSSRFTIAGLYMTASGFLAAAIFKDTTRTGLQIALALFACAVTIVVWMLELRTRHLLAILTKRGREIERTVFGLIDGDHYAGFYSRQARIPPELNKEHGMEHDFTILVWNSNDLPRWLAKRLTHSFAFDLLFLSGLIFWLGALIVFLWQLR